MPLKIPPIGGGGMPSLLQEIKIKLAPSLESTTFYRGGRFNNHAALNLNSILCSIYCLIINNYYINIVNLMFVEVFIYC